MSAERLSGEMRGASSPTAHRENAGARWPEQDRAADDRRLARTLGWVSIGLGMTEIVAPRALGRAIGVGEHPALLRALGLREIASGLGLLSERRVAAWAWARVAGDAMDLALLGAAARNGNGNRGRIALAATAALGAAVLDVYSGRRFGRSPLQTHAPRVHVSHSLAINASPARTYAFWRNPGNLPLFMRHVLSANATSDTTSHWVVSAPAGTTVEWDAQIVEDVESARLAWRTLPDSQVVHEGAVNFEAAPAGRGTVVRVELTYEPPAGRVGSHVAKLFGKEPGQQIREDLQKLKQLLETGEIATTAGQPHGRRSLLGRATLGGRLS